MMRQSAWVFFVLLIGATLGASGLQAQRGYRSEKVQDLGIEFKVYEKLKPVPLKLGSGDSNLKARFEPNEASDYIHGRDGRYKWQLYIYEFDRAQGATTGDGEEAEELTAEEKATLELLKRMGRAPAKDFEDWVRTKDPSAKDRAFLVEGKEVRARNKTPAYTLWEYYDTQEGARGQIEWFKISACYDIDGKDIVASCVLPVKARHKPDKKWYGYAKSMVTSVIRLDEEESESSEDADRDQFADTPEKVAALAAAKENIENLGNWSYFTTTNYIVLYSWDQGKGSKGRREATLFAKKLGGKIQEIRQLFEEAYPPGDREFPFSVIRVCSDYTEFSNYGGTSGGVVGWFSPGTKELVVFYDADRRFGDPEFAIKISYHEAWHQYSDTYWPNVELHRWFDEGLAEYFSQFEKRGRSWRHEILDGRFRSIRNQLNEGTFIPIGDIIYWSRALFYGPRAPDHYAQAYSMADFILRGEKKLGRKWDPAWNDILKRYGDVAMDLGTKTERGNLSTEDLKVASEKAFEGVDLEAFNEAWITWVTKHMDR